MNKDKISKRGYLALAILFVTYSVVVFMIPVNKNSVYWLSYLFTIVAIAVQLYIFRLSFFKERSVMSKFYGFPIAQIGMVYLLAQLVLGIVFMLLSATVSLWIPVVLYILLLGAVGIGLIAVDTMRDEIEKLDQKLNKDVSFMRNLQSRVNVLVSQCETHEVRGVMEKFADDLRYSDPVGDELLKEIEQELSTCVDELQRAVIDNDITSTLLLCRKAEAILLERNRLCKINKYQNSRA